MSRTDIEDAQEIGLPVCDVCGWFAERYWHQCKPSCGRLADAIAESVPEVAWTKLGAGSGRITATIDGDLSIRFDVGPENHPGISGIGEVAQLVRAREPDPEVVVHDVVRRDVAVDPEPLACEVARPRTIRIQLVLVHDGAFIGAIRDESFPDRVASAFDPHAERDRLRRLDDPSDMIWCDPICHPRRPLTP